MGEQTAWCHRISFSRIAIWQGSLASSTALLGLAVLISDVTRQNTIIRRHLILHPCFRSAELNLDLIRQTVSVTCRHEYAPP